MDRIMDLDVKSLKEKNNLPCFPGIFFLTHVGISQKLKFAYYAHMNFVNYSNC